MTHKFRALGIALVAAFALTAVAASAASAHVFRAAGEGSTIVTAEQETTEPNVFTAGVPVTCGKAKFEGTAADNNEPTLTVRPTYTECQWNGLPAVVTTNHCAYILHGETTNNDGKVEIECATNNKIEVAIAGCTVKVGPQTVDGGVSYANVEANTAVTVTATATGIDYEKVGGIGCLFAGNGKEGKYDGAVLAKGYVDGGNSGTAYTPVYSEGAQKAIFIE